MNNLIKIKVNIRAYSNGVLPDVSKFIEDAPNDNNIYGRQDNKWVIIDGKSFGDEVELLDNSGLILNKEGNVAYLGIDQYIGTSLPNTLDNNKTYYIDENTIDIYINGGTPFDSDVSSEFGDIYQLSYFGGNPNTINWIYNLLPLNCEGE